MASCSGTGALGRRRTIDGAIATGFRAPNAARPLSCSKSSHSLHTRPRSALCTGAGTKPQQREVRRPYSAQTTSLRPRVPSSQSMSNLRSSLPQRRAVPVRDFGRPAATKCGMSEAKLEVYSDLWDAIIVQDEAYGKLLTKVKRAYDSYIHKLRAQKGLPVGMSKAARQAYDGLERGNSGVLQQRECIEEVSLDDSQVVSSFCVMFKGRSNHPHSSGWWYGGGRNLQELIRLENRHAAHANERPRASCYVDPFWEAASGHGRSVFKKGQRSPHFNASRQAADCLHGLVHSKSFPDLKSLGAGEDYPGFPGMTTSNRRWEDCFSIEKPLVNARRSWEQDGDDAARAAAYTSKRPPLHSTVYSTWTRTVTPSCLVEMDRTSAWPGASSPAVVVLLMPVGPPQASLMQLCVIVWVNPILVPRDAIRVEVDPSSGGAIHWPPVLSAHSTRLDEVAEGWYRYCRRGVGPFLWNKSPFFIVAMVCVVVFGHALVFNAGSSDADAEESEEEEMEAAVDIALVIAATVVPILFMTGVLLGSYVSVRRHFQEMGRRLGQALQGTGYAATVHTKRREKHSRAPDGLEQGCCSMGWLWIDFIPQTLNTSTRTADVAAPTGTAWMDPQSTAQNGVNSLQIARP
ncbi:hypothetical protein FOZ60_003192 [Perkinsus olseni]|uniref:Translin-associated factor X-interacting protein 1 N-terminal domain-containing protein n=1 Tax=Perkinsus olseni TaxID=32597 RepID=A0A7J6NX05_PEROL|nr:hypothetical protein FOZ60_003192 [Perkinsus olseni]